MQLGALRPTHSCFPRIMSLVEFQFEFPVYIISSKYRVGYDGFSLFAVVVPEYLKRSYQIFLILKHISVENNTLKKNTLIQKLIKLYSDILYTSIHNNSFGLIS